MEVLRRWWPLGLLLPGVIAAQIVVSRQFPARGHAADHLSSAGLVYALTVVVGIVVLAVRGPLWRRVELWLFSLALVLAATVSTVGNLRVVDAIAGEDWSDADAQRLGPSRDGFVSGHELVDDATWAVVALAVLLALWLWRGQRLSAGAAVASVAASLFVPRWIFAGAGLLVVAAALIIDERCRRLASDR